MKRQLFTTALAFGAAAWLALAGAGRRGRRALCASARGRSDAGHPDRRRAGRQGGRTGGPRRSGGARRLRTGRLRPACCPEPCLEKVCVPSTATRVIRKRVYSEACEDFCLPKCPHCGLTPLNLHHDCDSGCGGCAAPTCGTCGTEGGCANCDKPRVRKYLVVKIRTREECYTKCNIAFQAVEPKCGHKAACCDTGCAAPVVVSDGVKPLPGVMPPAEKVPAPKAK